MQYFGEVIYALIKINVLVCFINLNNYIIINALKPIPSTGYAAFFYTAQGK